MGDTRKRVIYDPVVILTLVILLFVIGSSIPLACKVYRASAARANL